MQLVILAGGKGTRLGLSNIPKSMVRIGGKPVLLHQIELARRYGIDEVFILEGYLSHVIQDYFGDGSRFGIKIYHIVEPAPLGTAGAIKLLEEKITDDFLVFYGDIVMDFDIARFIDFASKKPAVATLVAHPCNHPYDSDLMEIDGCGKIIAFLSKPHPVGIVYSNLDNACIYILSPKIFKFIPYDKMYDFGRDIFPKLLAGGLELRAYKTPEYIYDMGTKDRLADAVEDMKSGKVMRMNRKNRRAAIFLDRDGTINKDMGGKISFDSFELLPKAADAIRKINKSEYLAIVATNQPMIAKGFLSLEEYRNITKKMETLLGREGVFIDATYFCPHHPDRGFAGEAAEFKIDCKCRKPGAGMLFEAADDMNIALEHSWIIGDSDRDIEAGRAAGVRGLRIGVDVGNLGQAVDRILKENGNGDRDALCW